MEFEQTKLMLEHRLSQTEAALKVSQQEHTTDTTNMMTSIAALDAKMAQMTKDAQRADANYSKLGKELQAKDQEVSRVRI